MSIFDSHSRKAFYLVKQFRIGDCAMCIGAIFFLILFDFGLKLFLKTISQFSRKQDSKRIQNRSINSFLRHLRVKQVTCFCFVFYLIFVYCNCLLKPFQIYTECNLEVNNPAKLLHHYFQTVFNMFRI